MRSIFISLFFTVLLLQFQATGQPLHPEVAYQSGFSSDTYTGLAFSPRNHFLLGYNEMGEFILWDLKSSKQVKKFSARRHEVPELYYFPKATIADDEQHILVPDWPEGRYMLYNVNTNKVAQTFTPRQSDVFYTNAFFSKSGDKLLLIAQKPIDHGFCNIDLYSLDGTFLKSWSVTLPPLISNSDVDWVMNKLYKVIRHAANIKACATDEELNRLYMITVGGKILSIDLTSASGGQVTAQDLAPVPGPDLKQPEDIQVYNNRVIIKAALSGREQAGVIIRSEKITVMTPGGSIERTVESSLALAEEQSRSNAVTCSLSATNHAMSVYFQTRMIEGNNFEIAARDVFTDAVLFTYIKGTPYMWNTPGPYKGGQLNGGLIMDVSADQTRMIECTRELVIHDIKEKKINNVISYALGNIKLNAPLFINNTSVLIPKVTTDAYIFNLKTAGIDCLEDVVLCHDTARNGVNMTARIFDDALIGINSACMSPDGAQIITANHIPYTLCDAVNNRTIKVWDATTRVLQKTYNYHDDNFVYFLHTIPPEPSSFLLNDKLVKFAPDGTSTVKELYIKLRKDTFRAVNPVYLAKSNTIFAVLGNRGKKGSSDLIFAHFNLQGELIKSYRYERKESKMDFEGFIMEACLSPGQDKLLFGMYDGTAGIFDIDKMQVTSQYHQGKSLTIKIVGVYGRVSVIAGCFIDNTHFITTGIDGIIREWTEGAKNPDREINKEPLLLFSAVLSPDKRYLVGTSLDKSVKFIDLKTGNTTASFIGLDPRTYAVIDEDGYYLSNKKSGNNLWFFYGGKTYEFSQFDLTLNRPDKVIEKLGFASQDETERLKKRYEYRYKNVKPATATLSLQNLTAPEITLGDLPANIQETQASELNFSVIATDQQAPISRLFISVNGVPLHSVNGLNINQAKKTGTSKIPVRIPLTIGRNVISIQAMNQYGAQTLTESIDIKRTGVARKPDLYVIAVGSGKFQEKTNNLVYAAKDANDIAALFSGNKAFDKIHTSVITDERATRANILSIKNMLKKSEPEDFVLLFYAGHGFITKTKNYFLSTYNTNFKQPGINSLSFDEVNGLLDSIPSRNKIMMIDACYSGELDPDAVVKGTSQRGGQRGATVVSSEKSEQIVDVMNDLFADLRRTNGATIIAACGGTQVALESNTWNNGAFTYCIKQGLQEQKADIDKNGRVTVSELVQYLRRNVAAITGGKQIPTSRTENLVNDFIIW